MLQESHTNIVVTVENKSVCWSYLAYSSNNLCVFVCLFKSMCILTQHNINTTIKDKKYTINLAYFKNFFRSAHLMCDE